MLKIERLANGRFSLNDRLEVESVAALRRMLGLDAVGPSSASDFAHAGNAPARMDDALRLEQLDAECDPGQLGAFAGVRGEKPLARLQAQEDVNRSSAEYSAKPRFRDLAQLTDRVMKRTRLAVKALCSPAGHIPSLGTAFATLLTESGLSSAIRCQVVEEGRPRILRALLWDEVYTIGREAIVYAFRHSGATQIEIEIQYLAGRLRMDVRDDGRGIDPRELRQEGNGECGLQGMHRRAQRIGAQLSIFSRVGVGTELDLCIPGPIAFAQINSGRSSESGERGADDILAKVRPTRTTNSNPGGVS
jgi:anti-sigma regulatory factor (Ser/Thr protein kinase)